MKCVTIVLMAVVAALLFCGTAWAQEQEPATKWQAVGLASDDLVSGRLRYTPPGRVAVGGEVAWMDGIAAGQIEGWRFAFVGTYDLIDSAPLKLPVVGEIPATWYVGGLGGVLIPQAGSADATAALTTGLVLGGERASIGTEYQYLLTDELWQALAPIDDQHRLLFYAALRF